MKGAFQRRIRQALFQFLQAAQGVMAYRQVFLFFARRRGLDLHVHPNCSNLNPPLLNFFQQAGHELPKFAGNRAIVRIDDQHLLADRADPGCSGQRFGGDFIPGLLQYQQFLRLLKERLQVGCGAQE